MRIALNSTARATELAGKDVKRALVRLFTAPERTFELLMLWQSRAASRYRLAELGSEHLRDMGIDAAQCAAETGKPFWRA